MPIIKKNMIKIFIEIPAYSEAVVGISTVFTALCATLFFLAIALMTFKKSILLSGEDFCKAAFWLIYLFLALLCAAIAIILFPNDHDKTMALLIVLLFGDIVIAETISRLILKLARSSFLGWLKFWRKIRIVKAKGGHFF